MPSEPRKSACRPQQEAEAIETAAAQATLSKSRKIADTFVSPGSPSSLAYWFAELYFWITWYEIEHRRVFSYPAFVMHFIPIFYDMYAKNAEHFMRQEWNKIAPAWQEHFSTSAALVYPEHIYPYVMSATKSLVTGVRAHIQDDMPNALFDAYRSYAAKYCNTPRFDTYHPDFFVKNRPIFINVRNSVINELLNRGLGLQMPGRRGVDPSVAGKVAEILKQGLDIDEIYKWRQKAWEKAGTMIEGKARHGK